MMNTARAVLGVDVSKRKSDLALLVNGKIKSKVVENTSDGFKGLEVWLLKQKVNIADLHACLEATGVYSEPVALALVAMGMTVSVVNPARVKGFAQSEMVRNKNDVIDAAILARFCAEKTLEPWSPPPPAYRELRAWVDRLQALKDIRQQEMNRIEAHDVVGQAALVSNVRLHVEWLDTQISALEKDIDDHIERHPDLKRDAELMKSIKGLGTITVAKIMGYAGDVRRFTSAKALAAFIGVSPRQRQSGTTLRGRTIMCRTGHKTLRTALYMPGLVARQHNPLLSLFAERLRATGMAKKAVIGAVMRKLVHLIYGVVTSGKPFDPNFLQARLDLQDGI